MVAVPGTRQSFADDMNNGKLTHALDLRARFVAGGVREWVASTYHERTRSSHTDLD